MWCCRRRRYYGTIKFICVVYDLRIDFYLIIKSNKKKNESNLRFVSILVQLYDCAFCPLYKKKIIIPARFECVCPWNEKGLVGL